MGKRDMTTKFKTSLIEKLREKDLNETTINFYLRNLERLNGDKPLTDFKFLKDEEAVNKILSTKMPNTQRNYLISISSTLGTGTAKDKIIGEPYYDRMMTLNKELKSEEAKGIKTEAQKKNWMSQEETEDIRKRYESSYDKIKNDKTITENSYDALLRYLILSLYTLIPPRRNKDYQNMYLIKNMTPSDDSKNYVDLKNKQFIFNDFKTVKTEGRQIIAIPDNLMEIINTYVRFHPLLDGKEKSYEVPFLVDFEGRQIIENSGMTKLLNRIFQKKVGSSMLRHMYLSNKYGAVQEEQAKDAKAMSHSVAQQKDYIKH